MEEVRFIITHEDYWRYTLYAFFRRRRIWISLLLLLIGGTLVLLSTQGIPYILLFVVLIVVFYAFALWRNASKGAQVARKRGMNIVSISSEGIRQRHEMGDSTTSWRAFKAIREDKYNFYFLLDSPGLAMMAFLIPKRAFASPKEAESFIGQARGYWREQAEQISTAH
jgi:hypothetical protein